MTKPIQRPEAELTLAQEVTALADRFAEFSSLNAFLCKSLTAVMSANEPLRPDVIEGAKYCAESLDEKALELKRALDHVRARCLAK